MTTTNRKKKAKEAVKSLFLPLCSSQISSKQKAERAVESRTLKCGGAVNASQKPSFLVYSPCIINLYFYLTLAISPSLPDTKPFPGERGGDRVAIFRHPCV